jgi:hypothetical protein
MKSKKKSSSRKRQENISFSACEAIDFIKLLYNSLSKTLGLMISDECIN